MVDNEYMPVIYDDASKLTKLMATISHSVNFNYLKCIQEMRTIAPSVTTMRSRNNIGIFKLDRIIYNDREDVYERLVNVFSAMNGSGSTIAVILQSDGRSVDFYFATLDNLKSSAELLKRNLTGNFPGCSFSEIDEEAKIDRILNHYNCEKPSDNVNISSLSIIPNRRTNEISRENNLSSHGIEKFIDAMKGKKYTTFFIAEEISNDEIERRKLGLQELSTSISPFEKKSYTLGKNYSNAVNKSLTQNVSETITSGITKSYGRTSNTTNTTGKNWGQSDNNSTPIYDMTSVFTHTASGQSGSGSVYGEHSDSSQSYGTSESDTDSNSTSRQTGSSESSGNTETHGNTYSENINVTNKHISDNLSQIEKQIERISQNKIFGMWNCCCYVITENGSDDKFATRTLSSLFSGESELSAEPYYNKWISQHDTKDDQRRSNILKYLSVISHPSFSPNDELVAKQNIQDMTYTASMLVSSKELPVIMGMPLKSVTGVSVGRMAEFGRNISYPKKDKTRFLKKDENPKRFTYGSIYHMGQTDSTPIEWDLQDFNSHCFITGSSGIGKTTTVCNFIDNFISKGIKFLCIEPVKGEYKFKFGGLKDINVFTSDPRSFRLLRINPFEFNTKLNITEHIDRLVSTISACWPLYNSMPSILKRGFEKAYISLGWDLNLSKQIKISSNTDNRVFPDFNDLKIAVTEIINNSDYSAQAKGDYKGSLLERINSLCSGFEQQIFCRDRDGVSDELLFNSNCIIDISNIGAAETRSLLMGLLIIKLQEYHTVTSNGEMNSPLKHITVLEEAHNILKRCSMETSTDSSSIQSASVKMLIDCIAEMRTYGEGFLIVDQSPTSVDEAAIKNTAVKVVMRLPEKNDCEQIGNALTLNEEQITELSKLDVGIAAVFCRGWQDTVLSKFDEESIVKSKYKLKDSYLINRSDLPYIRGAVVYLMLSKIYDNDFDSINRNTISDIIDDGIRVARIEFTKYKKAEIVDIVAGFVNRNKEITGTDFFNKNLSEFFVSFLQMNEITEICKPSFSIPIDSSVIEKYKPDELSKWEASFRSWFNNVLLYSSNYVILPNENDGDMTFNKQNDKEIKNNTYLVDLMSLCIYNLAYKNWAGNFEYGSTIC
jgi:Cdc6-like AAA superfamily ATPase